jgi:XTP/dITP diphosphohydrolase
VLSAYYAGREGTREERDARNNARLVADLANVEDRSAFYYCVLVLVTSPIDPTPIVVDGTWHGTIVTTPAASGGFGYDPTSRPSSWGSPPRSSRPTTRTA